MIQSLHPIMMQTECKKRFPPEYISIAFHRVKQQKQNSGKMEIAKYITEQWKNPDRLNWTVCISSAHHWPHCSPASSFTTSGNSIWFSDTIMNTMKDEMVYCILYSIWLAIDFIELVVIAIATVENHLINGTRGNIILLKSSRKCIYLLSAKQSFLCYVKNHCWPDCGRRWKPFVHRSFDVDWLKHAYDNWAMPFATRHDQSHTHRDTHTHSKIKQCWVNGIKKMSHRISFEMQIGQSQSQRTE